MTSERARRPAADPSWRLTVDRRGRPTTTASDREEIRAWFLGNLVDGWFVGEPEIVIDDYEILVLGELAAPAAGDDGSPAQATAEAARIARFRTDTRERRIEIAGAAEARFSRKVSWGARSGSSSVLFTTTSVPVMTRLHLGHRRTLDTLVDAGVARSRSEALAWCVELVTTNEDEWITQLREALDAVVTARDAGPASTR